MMRIYHPFPSTDLSMTGGLFTPNDENGSLLPQHRAANEESGQCAGAVGAPDGSLFLFEVSFWYWLRHGQGSQKR